MSYENVIIDGCGFAKAAYVRGKHQLAHRFLARVFNIMENEECRIIVCWDHEDNISKRLEKYPNYKRKRREKREIDDNQRYDLEYIKEARELVKILQLLGVDQAWSEGWEADDVMGTLARKLESPMLILTRDGDILQLVREDIDVLLKIGKKETIYTPHLVKKEMGFSPIELTDWKAMAGDTGDDVPGMPGVGVATATEIIKVYPSFVGEVLNGTWSKEKIPLNNFTKRALTAIKKISYHPNDLRLMRWLVELHNVPITFKRSCLNIRFAIDEMKSIGLIRAAVRTKSIFSGGE